ncbi:MAG: class I SAM-dependent methyltransferase [Opitutae bacterium]|jgi:ubiquinone/menaquinone biosynthesis C-methylase UbiE|nr:class I SAM-dependent methyltransferase [Opitutae bacterium]
MSVFGEFAKYYDLVHENKDYEQESSYIHGLIQKHNPKAKTILDIGCGTGNYAFAMHELGYGVSGVDSSSQMIEIAKGKLSEEARETSSPSFFCGKMEDHKCQTKSDAVICLFFSLCYQTTDDLIFESLSRFKDQMKEDGILIFDFWNKAGVLNERPNLKIQKYTAEGLEVTKLVEPTLDTSVDCVGIDYTFYIENEQGGISKFKEFHKVRYLCPELLEEFLENLNFQVEITEGWMTNQKLKINEWSGLILARQK